MLAIIALVVAAIVALTIFGFVLRLFSPRLLLCRRHRALIVPAESLPPVTGESVLAWWHPAPGGRRSRPMKPSSLVWVSAPPGTSTRGPYWPEERITCSICSIPPRS